MKKYLLLVFVFISAFTFGQQWHLSHLDHNRDMNSVFIHAHNAICLGGGNEVNDSIQALYRSNDYGLTWNYNATDTISSWIKYITFKDSLNGFGVGFNGKMVWTNNSGQLWNYRSSPINRDFNKVVYATPQTLYIAGGKKTGNDYQTILKSTDGGASWNVIYDQPGPWLSSIWFLNADTGIAVGDSGTILMTTNAGAAWNPVSAPVQRDFDGIAFINGTTGFMVGGQRYNDSVRTILKTIDGGSTWTVVKDEPGGWLTDISFLNAGEGYIVGDKATYYHTTNSGANWVQETVNNSQPDDYFTSVRFFDHNFGVITGRFGNQYIYDVVPVPTAYTLGSTINDSISATLMGAVNSHSYPAAYEFVLSTSPNFSLPLTTFEQTVNSDTLSPVSYYAHGLPANTLYYYYLSARSLAGSVHGDTLSFYLGTPYQTFLTQDATSVTTSSAQLNGVIDKFSYPVTLYFEWGNTPSFGNQIATTPATVNDTLSHAITASLSGLSANTFYYFRLKGVSTNGTYYGDTKLFFTGTVTGTYQTLPAVSVTDTTAILRGEVSGFHLPITVSFQYGTTINLNNQTQGTYINDSTYHLTAVQVGGLQRYTTYYYRLKVETGLGTYFGNTTQFYTGSAFSDFATLPATNITASSAQLNGTASQLTLSTNLTFEYGTTPSLGSTIVATPATINDTGSYHITANLTGLTPNTFYYYKLKGLTSNNILLDGSLKQFYATDCEIPNCDFEVWDSTGVEIPTGWNTMGITHRVPSYNGSSAIEVTGASANDGGAVILGVPNNDAVSGGVPFNQRPDSIVFHARYNIVPGDTAFVVTFFRHNAVFINMQLFPITGNSAGSFIEKRFPVIFNAPDLPDTMNIGVVSTNVFSNVANGASILAVDDISFIGSNIPIPNSNFELWDSTYHVALQSWYYNDDNTAVYRQVEKTTDRVSGNYAVRMHNDLAISNSTAQVMVGNGSYDQPSFPVAGRHNTFNLYLKYQPDNHDTLRISADMYLHGTRIGSANAYIDSAIANYIPMEIPVYYTDTALATPDSAAITISIGNNMAYGNSVAYVDNLSFDGFHPAPLGINVLQLLQRMYCKVYPNPATNELYIEFVASAGACTYQIYDLTGKMMSNTSESIDSAGKILRKLDISSLPAGAYFVRVTSGKITTTQKIIVTR